MNKINLVEYAKENNINVELLSHRVNIIYELADVQEQYFALIEKDLNKLGAKVPKFKQEVYEIKKAIRALVGTVHKVCKPETTEAFGNDSDTLFEVVNNFYKSIK